MRQFTSDEIQAQFEKLPQEVKDAITSAEINNKVLAIAKKYGLLIDQTGELIDEVGLVMLGLSRSSDFVNNVSTRCSLDRLTSQKIAEDIGAEVFFSIRQHMREIEENIETEHPGEIQERIKVPTPDTKTALHSALEKAGDFQIEKEINHNGEMMGTNGAQSMNVGLGAYGRADRINHLENEIEKAPEVVKIRTDREMQSLGGIEIKDESNNGPVEEEVPAIKESTVEPVEIKEKPRKGEVPTNLPGATEVIGITDEHTEALPDQLLGSGEKKIEPTANFEEVNYANAKPVENIEFTEPAPVTTPDTNVDNTNVPNIEETPKMKVMPEAPMDLTRPDEETKPTPATPQTLSDELKNAMVQPKTAWKAPKPSGDPYREPVN